jgi:3-methyladenine DNA glycosylase AlkD
MTSRTAPGAVTPAARTPAGFVRAISAALAPIADPARVQPMTAYMRDQFAFLGVAAPDRRAATRAAIRSLVAQRNAALLLDSAAALWRKREREFHYTAVDLLVAGEKILEPAALPTVSTFITTQSWWDTVDPLAADVIGPLVARHPTLIRTMDAWSGDDHLWLRRTAILHQLKYGARTDARRLFAYCVANADDPDFFIRKAIGWALRQFAYADRAAVQMFLTKERARLSPLSLREAGKHLPNAGQAKGGTAS